MSALVDPEQLKLLQPPKKQREKFGNKRVTLDDISFGSMAEAARYVVLKDCEAKRQIFLLQVHPPFRFECGQRYIADFAYVLRRDHAGRSVNVPVVEDVKGGDATRTALYRRNKAMMSAEFGVQIQEIEVQADVARALIAGYKGESSGRK